MRIVPIAYKFDSNSFANSDGLVLKLSKNNLQLVPLKHEVNLITTFSLTESEVSTYIFSYINEWNKIYINNKKNIFKILNKIIYKHIL